MTRRSENRNRGGRREAGQGETRRDRRDGQPTAGSGPDAARFHLPYQFVPVTGKVGNGPAETFPWPLIDQGAHANGEAVPTRHDLWLSGTRSGRILCRLDLVTPTFVGARQSGPKAGPKTAHHYKRHNDCAIPGNSLRGMVAAVAEALSQSALRVLEDRYYSVRKPVNQRLSLEGTIQRKGAEFLVTPDGAHPDAGLPIPKDVLERFSRLWLERHQAEKTIHGGGKPSFFPHAFGSARPTDSDLEHPDDWRPAPNMRVRYATKSRNGATVVAEISFSQIWRREVNGTAHAYFRAIGPDLIPWGHDGRTGLTPAEALFGVVEDRPERNRARGKNLAGRLRFHDALPELPQGETAVRRITVAPKALRILASPKPPSPALYFHRKGQRGAHVGKVELAGGSPSEYVPNGRKRYLSHPESQVAAEWWWSKEPEATNAKQKLKCRPMDAGQRFWFHIDFDNLTPPELTLLLAALEPETAAPQPGFLHRLGLGKPLGLGSVKVSTWAVLTLDRATRYSRAALDEVNSYHEVHVPDPGTVPAWPARYAADIPPQQPPYPPLSDLTADPALIDSDTRAILARIGARNAIAGAAWVVYPLIASQVPKPSDPNDTACETKTYAWFVENEKVVAPQALGPVDPETPLPTIGIWMTLEVRGSPVGEWRSDAIKAKLEGLLRPFGPPVVSVSKPKHEPGFVAKILMTAEHGKRAMAHLLSLGIDVRLADP